jgi:hypothetical protein
VLKKSSLLFSSIAKRKTQLRTDRLQNRQAHRPTLLLAIRSAENSHFTFAR